MLMRAVIVVTGVVVAALAFRAAPVADAAAPGADRAAPSVADSSYALRFADVRLPDGVRLRYGVQGDPAGEAVILLHGYSDSWFSFSGVLQRMPARFRVYVPDQRGHGDSDRPTDGYTMSRMGRDVIAFMDALGIRRATLVGHSMGSFVAQHMAAQAPERIEALVLMGSTTVPAAIVGLDELVAAVNEMPDPMPREFIEEFQRSTAFAPVPDEFMERAIAESGKLPLHVWRGIAAGLASAEPVVEQVARARIRTLVLWGEEDGMFPRAEQDRLAAMLRARLIAYEATGHALHWERPAEVTRDIVAFLDD